MIQLIIRFFFGTPESKVVQLVNRDEVKYIRGAMQYYISENSKLTLKLKLWKSQN